MNTPIYIAGLCIILACGLMWLRIMKNERRLYNLRERVAKLEGTPTKDWLRSQDLLP